MHQAGREVLLWFVGEERGVCKWQRFELVSHGFDNGWMTMPEAGHRRSAAHVEVSFSGGVGQSDTLPGRRDRVALSGIAVQNGSTGRFAHAGKTGQAVAEAAIRRFTWSLVK
jgi:hypothetical protein